MFKNVKNKGFKLSTAVMIFVTFMALYTWTAVWHDYQWFAIFQDEIAMEFIEGLVTGWPGIGTAYLMVITFAMTFMSIGME